MIGNIGEGNLGGIVKSTAGQEMSCYDALPPRIRAALCEAPEKWSAISVAQVLASGKPESLVLSVLKTVPRETTVAP